MHYNLPSRIWMLLVACTITTIAVAAPPDKAAMLKQSAARQLSFTENKGQITDQYYKPRKDVDYKLDAGGMSIFVGDGQLHYQWQKYLAEEHPNTEGLSRPDARNALHDYMEKGVRTEIYRMDVSLVGANRNAEVIAEEKQEYSENYYVPHFKGSVASYNKITYRNIYPNIDWVLYSRDNEIKYDFIVHPGGDPKHIKLQYSGATALKLEEGAMVATTPYGSVTEKKPYTYNAGTRAEIPSAFRLSEGILSFDLAVNKSTNDIVIDPILDWATYYGGSNSEYGLDVASNNMGDAIMAGLAFSTNNIATVGAYQTSLSGATDGFMVKFNLSGLRQWATYFGGNATDRLSSIACDPAGNIYVAGDTYSNAGIATVGAHQTVVGGNYDAVLARFTAGGTLLWSTYFGGTQGDYGEVACDGAGNVYMCGQTASTNAIATVGTHQSSNGGNADAYLSRWSSAGVLVWATYFGGSDYDWANGIECDLAGNIYMAGTARSTTGIATTGAHQTVGGVGAVSDDGFLSKWTNAGVLLWATYYGGSGWDQIYDVATDAGGNVYVSGTATSTSGIATTGAHQTVRSGNGDGFIAKFSSLGVQQWGTYYGGTGGDDAGSIAIGVNGYVYVGGVTQSTTGIATTNSHQSTLAGQLDAFLAEFTQAGVHNWATYYGGPGIEYFGAGSGSGTSSNVGIGMAASSTGKLYFMGTTSSTAGIATAGVHQGALSGTAYDVFLTSWTVDTIVYVHQPYSDTSLCPGQSFDLQYRTTYNFRNGNIFTAQLSDGTGSFTLPITIGSKADVDSGFMQVTIPRNILPGTGYRIRIIATNPARTSADNGMDIRIKPLPQVTASSNSPVCENAALNLNATSTTPGTIIYNWSGPLGYSAGNNPSPTRGGMATNMAGKYAVTAILNGCSSYDTTEVVVNTLPARPVAGGNSPACPNTPINLTALSATPGVTYNWTGPLGFTSPLQHPNVTGNAASAMAGRYIVTASLSGCISEPDTVDMVVDITTPTPVATANTPLCAGLDVNLTATSIPGATYGWTGPNGYTSTLRTPTITAIQPWQAGKYTVVAIINNCVSRSADVDVQVIPVPFIGAYASPDDTICQGFTATFIAFPQNPGLIPEYQWYKNFQPIAGADKLIYTSNSLVTGDRIYCQMIAAGVCDNPIIATTDTFDMVVLPIVTVPAVTITANPGLGVSPQQQVVFTANVQNGGTTPKYQWYKNGTLQAGARYATWTTSGMNFGDRISVQIISEDPCANEKTAGDTVVIEHPTSIRDNGNSNKGLKLYPNPNKGSFTVSGISGREVTVAISNVIGQVVYKETAQNIQGQLELSTRLPKGVYLLRISSENSKQEIIKFTITE